ncbi:MAG: M20/M25/M40 family metallo-hydrolase [Acidaminococcus sp.]|jgi:acetylornithine deacetylase/succinyl-diaminopimelate desuccinylase-like protein|nr:M20/M25/M40 family metallo-hydrolase [Acidaminococcus sp.]MCI2100052.1 M20/M25/M40 family metallo-hydrolase [Acidaminococcus sp.]MCI2114350.1 M20/M25/M40 family metallo-hydrolase [Acidaminococcus sp.]MCI2116263.1 M20/M25/M40 family metallo-hydrolase [Acidaminococcus sp.]
MNEVMQKMVDQYIDANMPSYVQRLYDVASIVSPTGEEANKAHYILDELHKLGAKEAYIDEAGNVVYPHNLPAEGKFPLYTAHMDTVFAGVDKIVPEIDGTTMRAPSIGDNSSNVAALLFLIEMFLKMKQEIPAVFAFNVGEEGLGNLKGSRYLTDTWQDCLSYFIAVDGDCDRFVNEAVGSHRYAVHVVTKGGHSFANFGNTNAIERTSAIIEDFYAIQVPKTPKTTYNIGTIQGGRTVNAIAADVEFTVDMRSVSYQELLKLDAAFHAILDKYRSDKVTIETKLIGDRPCGEGPMQHEIYDRITAIRARNRKMTRFEGSSTDANIALSRKIPAMAFGVAREKGVHTLQEELDLTSVSGGLKQLAAFMLNL